ncbi:MAG: V-type ATP synthase subunit D [Ruminococcus sp.]|nr:V-type ATP synthase subunit D [Ruminococcus sp.]
MAQQVFPTKGNLIASKKSLALAQLGFDLLDRKRNILIREIMQLSDEAKKLQGSIDKAYIDAYDALRKANISLGVISRFAKCVPVEKGINLSTRSVMGTELVNCTLDKTPKKLYYGLSQTDSRLDEAYMKFDYVKELTLKLAQTENNIYRLSIGIKKAGRRANALKNIMIPRYEEQVRFISSALEEKEREEFSRMKVIKSAKLKKQTRTAAGGEG